MSLSTSKLRVGSVPLNIINPPVILTGSSKAGLLLWILLVICVSCLSLLYCRVCSVQPCDQLLGKGGSLGSLVCDVFLRFYHFPIWCPGSGVVLDFINC